MKSRSCIQIHQYNDPEILEFFNEHRVQYRLVGDHLFIVRSRGHDEAVGPGDWLMSGPDGQIDVQRGDYARRAQSVIENARRARTITTRLRNPLAASNEPSGEPTRPDEVKSAY